MKFGFAGLMFLTYTSLPMVTHLPREPETILNQVQDRLTAESENFCRHAEFISASPLSFAFNCV